MPKHVLTSLRNAARGFAVSIESATARDHNEIKAAMAQLASAENCGVIVPSDPTTNSQHKLFVELTARYRLPTIFASLRFVRPSPMAA